jgi:hypothetical protein
MTTSGSFSVFYSTLRNNGELVCWITALVVLFFLPEGTGQSLCLFKAIGFTACPGCGIGHSMHDALRLRLGSSINHHPLGIIAILIIFNRITLLFKATNKTV